MFQISKENGHILKNGTKALGGKKAVAEWEKATGNKKLPQYVKKKGK